MSFYVYVHKKKTTGEVFYVGKGKGSRANSKTNRSNYWKSTVKKHGHIVEYIEVDLQEWAAFEIESNLISLYGRKDIGLGPLVNLSDGGEGSAGHIWTDDMKTWRSIKTKEFMAIPENRQHLSKIKSGVPVSEEQAIKNKKNLDDNRVVARKAVSNYLKGKWQEPEFRSAMITRSRSLVMSEEAKAKISVAHSKAIKRSDGVIYQSVAEAAKALNKNHSKISMAANKKRNTAYGFTWEYI